MTQQSYFGYGVYKHIDSILKKHTPKRIFFVTGKKSYSSSGAEKLIEPLIEPYNYTKFNDFEINPKLEDIEKGVKLFKNGGYDFMIGVGGGSVMDVAKSISILQSQKGNLKELVSNGENLESREIPLLMIPTTAGTGSESTHFAVIYIDKIKYSLANKSMLPDYTILDPTFTKSLPPYITACTGMDALCQAIESFWSTNSTDESMDYSGRAITLIMDNLPKVVNNPDKKSKENMLRGSNLAGKAIDISQTTAAHAVSYPMTSYFNIPHGHAVALTLPSFIEFNSKLDDSNIQDKRGVLFVKEKINKILDLFEVDSAKDAREKIVKLMEEINLKVKLSELGIIDDKGIKIIIDKGLNPQRTKNNPRRVSKEDIKKILDDIR